MAITCHGVAGIALKTQQRFQSHDLRISLWMSVITLLRIMQMKLAHGPLNVGYTKEDRGYF